jgi:hypothetical protein
MGGLTGKEPERYVAPPDGALLIFELAGYVPLTGLD